MDANYLKLNSEKTQIKIFSSKPSNPKVDKFLNIPCRDSVKVLGVNINNLKLQSFISNKVRTCQYHLRNCYNIKNSLDTATRTLLVINLILSTLDYSNILLLGSTDKDIRPLHLTLNRAIRFIFNLNVREHITPYYEKLHFLTVRKRIKFKACLFGFKIFNNQMPPYITESFNRFTPSVMMELRQGVGRDGFMFSTTTQELKKNDLFVKIKTEWNSLPLQIRECTSLTVFKKKLKTELFC